MVCPYCQSKTEVINSRHQKRTNSTWRRRQCLKCNAVITTLERIDYAKTWVVSDLQKSFFKAFSRDKLLLSVYSSLKHRKTAISDAEALIDTIISKLSHSCPDGQITKEDIVKTTLDRLKQFDKTAYVYYMAYFSKSK